MITRDMKIGDIIRNHHETLPIFQKHRLDCTECQVADLEELSHGAEVHRVDVEKLLVELNQIIECSRRS